MLQLLLRFTELTSLDIAIGMPEWEEKWWEKRRLKCGEIRLEKVKPKDKLPEDFMISFR
jgi:hypothetical protein